MRLSMRLSLRVRLRVRLRRVHKAEIHTKKFFFFFFNVFVSIPRKRTRHNRSFCYSFARVV